MRPPPGDWRSHIPYAGDCRRRLGLSGRAGRREAALPRLWLVLPAPGGDAQVCAAGLCRADPHRHGGAKLCVASTGKPPERGAAAGAATGHGDALCQHQHARPLVCHG
ncbi:MAG: hypothetical protein CL844_06520 [Crocinitomicaceae bacterium]|nr:hypothetical protein [Crocinitomicaceae bacterium]